MFLAAKSERASPAGGQDVRATFAFRTARPSQIFLDLIAITEHQQNGEFPHCARENLLASKTAIPTKPMTLNAPAT